MDPHPLDAGGQLRALIEAQHERLAKIGNGFDDASIVKHDAAKVELGRLIRMQETHQKRANARSVKQYARLGEKFVEAARGVTEALTSFREHYDELHRLAIRLRAAFPADASLLALLDDAAIRQAINVEFT